MRRCIMGKCIWDSYRKDRENKAGRRSNSTIIGKILEDRGLMVDDSGGTDKLSEKLHICVCVRIFCNSIYKYQCNELE